MKAQTCERIDEVHRLSDDETVGIVVVAPSGMPRPGQFPVLIERVRMKYTILER